VFLAPCGALEYVIEMVKVMSRACVYLNTPDEFVTTVDVAVIDDGQQQQGH
jgi:hypothetical protein